MTRTGNRSGVLVVLSAPSGTGKSTVARRVVERVENLEFSISLTTRLPRPGERDGVHYYFVSEDEFRKQVDRGGFLEFASVFGKFYGTALEPTRRRLEAGSDLLVDIDVQGAGQVRCGPIPSISIMILPPDFPTLEARLRDRGSENEEEIQVRLALARREAAQYTEFDYVVVNDELDATVEDVAAVIRAERLRAFRSQARVESIVATFPDCGES